MKAAQVLWPASYGAQSYAQQWRGGVRFKRCLSPHHVPSVRALMRPGPLVVSWPGWQPIPEISPGRFRRRV